MSQLYVRYENNAVLYEGLLPEVFGNVSGFNGLSNEELAAYNFYPLNVHADNIDVNTHKFAAPQYALLNNAVTKTLSGEPLSNEEIAAHLAQKWKNVRAERNRLLAATDWTQLLDAPVTEEKRGEYTTYRQTLRNIPQAFNNPDEVVFPALVA